MIPSPIVLILAIVQICSCQQDKLPFKCNLPSAVPLCQNGGICNPSTGTCDCSTASAPYMGSTAYDCSVDTSVECTTLTCSGHGQCYGAPGAETCLCDESYVFQNDKCVSRVLLFSCTKTQMSFIFTPYGEFKGRTYPVGFGVKPECEYGVGRLNTVTFEQATCGGPFDGGNDASGARSYKVSFMVQYLSTGPSGDDVIVDLTCNTAGDGSPATMMGSLVPLASPQTSNLGDDSIPDVITPKAGTIDTGFTVSLQPAGPVDLGDVLTLFISLDKAAGFADVFIKKIVAQPVKPAGDRTPEVVFVEDGCPLRSTPIITFTKETFAGNTLIKMTLKAFKFREYNTLLFTVENGYCTTDCEDLIQSLTGGNTCSDDKFLSFVDRTINDFNGDDTKIGKRRKRQTPNKAPENLTVGTYVIAPDIYTNHVYQTRITNTKEECKGNLVLILPLVILSVMLIVATVIAVYFCMKVSRDHKYRNKAGHMIF